MRLRFVHKIIPFVLIIAILSGCSIQTNTNAPVVNNQINTVPSDEQAGKQAKIHYIDVGQGDAILVQTAGQNMLIDAGDNDHGQEVVDYLKAAGVNEIDIVVGTHPHADHIGGMDTVLQAFPVKAVYMPRVTNTTKSFRDVLDAVEASNLKIQIAKAGTVLPLKGVRADIIAPVKDNYEDLNNYSAVVKVVCGEKVFLFMGDAEKESEEDMIKAGNDLKADVLKVGHHGSSSGTSTMFLDLVKPNYAVIMAGEGNPYGHPHREILSRLASGNTEILRTDINGTICISTDGNTLQISTEK